MDPIENGDIPASYVSETQRVGLFSPTSPIPEKHGIFSEHKSR